MICKNRICLGVIYAVFKFFGSWNLKLYFYLWANMNDGKDKLDASSTTVQVLEFSYNYVCTQWEWTLRRPHDLYFSTYSRFPFSLVHLIHDIGWCLKKIAAFLPKIETTRSVQVESLLDLGEAEQSRKVMKPYPMSCFDFSYSSCPYKIELWWLNWYATRGFFFGLIEVTANSLKSLQMRPKKKKRVQALAVW